MTAGTRSAREKAMQFIYIDESCSSGSTKYFVIALLVIKDTSSLKIIKRAIESLQKQTGKSEIKGSKLKEGLLESFVQTIDKAKYEIYAVVFHNCFEATDTNFKRNAIDLLLKNNEPAILHKITNNDAEKSYVIVDEHTSLYKFIIDYNENKFNYIKDQNKRFHYDLMDYYIKIHEEKSHLIENTPLPSIVERKSSDVQGLQAVDIFANSIKRKYADGMDKNFNLFSRNVKKIFAVTRVGYTFLPQIVFFQQDTIKGSLVAELK